MADSNADMKWEWPDGVHATDETFSELFASFREQTIKNFGRLLTEEEALRLTEEIRKELREEDGENEI